MYVIHFCNHAPKQSGMYESTKEQVKYERREGLQSDIIDTARRNPGDREDDGIVPVPWDEAKKADVWVLHHSIPDMVNKARTKQKRVAVLHGPQEHMLIQEWSGQGSSFRLHLDILRKWNYDAVLPVNKHGYDILKQYDCGGILRYIPNSIDLERIEAVKHVWEYRSHPAIGSFDTFRIEKLPAPLVWSMPKIVERIPTARLNLFSLSLKKIETFRDILYRSNNARLRKLCEVVQLEDINVKPFMKGIDIGFNSNFNGIAPRATMEMMAMGIPVVSYGGDYTKYHAKVFDLDSIADQIERCWDDLNAKGSTLKEDTKKFAYEHYNRAKTVKQYVKLYNEL